MADMPAIGEVAARHNLVVIEDAAQAHGARLNGKRAGAYGQAAAFSFYPTKNLGGYGDGGAVISNDVGLIQRVKRLREGGHQAALSDHVTGFNSRLDEIQAAMLGVKLRYLDVWNERRRGLADVYQAAFAETCVEAPRTRKDSTHVYHRYVVQSSDRDELRAFLDSHGIGTMIDYPFLNHEQPLLTYQRKHPQLPAAEKSAGRILTLPLYPQLREDEQKAVIDAVKDWDGFKRT
jgi:dTDP-4-amino-4,6-dideoxygalactose transaminase